MKKLIGALSATLMIVAACGGDTTPEDPATTVAEATTTTADPNAELRAYVATVMATEADAGELDITEAEGMCVTDATFDTIGADRFLEVGFDPTSNPAQAMTTFDDEWTEGEWSTLVNNLIECTDIESRFAELLTADGIEPEAAACLAAGMQEQDLIRKMLEIRDEDSPEFAEVMGVLGTLGAECRAGG